MLEVLKDALLDTGKLLPFLFLTYLAMEYLEKHMSGKTARMLYKAENTGPLIGAAAGVIPQCGFSATAAGFYAGGLITAGTLLAVFLSTSDEMIPVLLARETPVASVLKILSWKVVCGVLTGLIVDRFWRRKTQGGGRIREICMHENCSCGSGEGKILAPAVRHTVKTVAFIFVITFAAGILISLVGEDAAAAYLSGHTFAGILLMALIGLIPNCGASVMITTLFADGMISGGQMMAGLLVSAGVGVLVLIRNNRHRKENLTVIGLLYGAGVFWGVVLELLKVRF